jgi:hypothetical protein
MSPSRVEHRPPVTNCTRCGRPLWPGDIARTALVERPDPFGLDRERPRLVRECWGCAPRGGPPANHGPQPTEVER